MPIHTDTRACTWKWGLLMDLASWRHSGLSTASKSHGFIIEMISSISPRNKTCNTDLPVTTGSGSEIKIIHMLYDTCISPRVGCLLYNGNRMPAVEHVHHMMTRKKVHCVNYVIVAISFRGAPVSCYWSLANSTTLMLVCYVRYKILRKM